jgi:hypothetical protein
MPDLRLAFPGCQQKQVTPLVQHGHMWSGRKGATLLPSLEGAHRFLTRTAELTSNPDLPAFGMIIDSIANLTSEWIGENLLVDFKSQLWESILGTARSSAVG